MYLSALEIVGFKSFAQKTNFRFTPGITAIVGPNGCGKTNVVDAIRWVLGEQKSAILRSEVMENVIFNGTSARKALGMAEVSMTIKNSKGILPTDYTEVNISRRLFRDGESQYLINNTQCRLKDIVDLFMDTGVGADTYSVIELKMIEAILSGKPEERRHLLEEAAGVTKYKVRRKEATKKLAQVQNDLLRVQDIVSEVEKNVASLARQAAKTRKYNKLSSQLKEIEITLLKIDYLNGIQDLDKFKLNLDSLQSEKAAKEKDIDDNEILLAELEKKLYQIDDEFQKAAENENLINSEIAEKTKIIAVSDEKISSLNSNQQRILNEIQNSENGISEFKQAIGNATSKISELKSENELSSVNFENQKETLNQKIRLVNDFREELNQTNENLINTQNKLNSISAGKKRNEQRLTDLDHRINDSNSVIENNRKIISEIELNSKNLLLENTRLKEELLNLETRVKSESERLNELQAKSAELQKEITDRKISVSGKNASLDFLKGLIDSDETAKFLVKATEWQPESEKLTLAESLGTDDEYRVAVEAALGDAAHLFVVNKKSEAYSAFDLLKKSAKGKASFLCRENIPVQSAPDDEIQEQGVLGWISELVRTDDSLRNALRLILGRTALTESLEIAHSIVDSGKANYAVSLSGEITGREGLIRGGSVSTKEGITVGKKERITKIQKEISTLNKEIEQLESESSETKNQISKINLPELNAGLRKTQAELHQLEQNISQLSYKKESNLSSISMIEQNLARFFEELSAIQKENEMLETEFSELEDILNKTREIYKVQQNDLAKAEKEWAEQQEISKAIELETVRLNAEINSLEKEIVRLNQQQDYTAVKIVNLKSEFDTNQKTVADLQESVLAIRLTLSEIQKDFDKARTEKEYLHQQKTSLEEQISQYTQDVSAKRKAFEKFIESIHQYDLQTIEIRTKINTLKDRALENYEIDLDAFEIPENPEFSVQEARINVTEIKDRLLALGMVNFMALDEYDSQSQRLVFYEAQVKDLVESEKTLQETIEEINQTAEEKFKSTFDAVNLNFQQLFKKLFNESGESELKLIGNNWLESDIEIMAKPPGKKPHSIEMLSGGEKTLTSIALLFGIYMVKPSPFCILDEVDAPLDDANIDKFLYMIRDFSNNTQFMIVTHNKRTMEFADTLYGVTMQEEGISKVVSVRLSPTLLNETISG